MSERASILPRLRHACLLHSETCVRRGKHLHASIFNSKCKHGDMQTCFSLQWRSGLLLRSQADGRVFAYIKAHPGPALRVEPGSQIVAPQCGRVKRKKKIIIMKKRRPAVGRSNPTSARPPRPRTRSAGPAPCLRESLSSFHLARTNKGADNYTKNPYECGV